MSSQRRGKQFRDGMNQTVHIPREFELSGEEAISRSKDERLVIGPTPPQSLLAVLSALEPLDEALPFIPELPADSVDLPPHAPGTHASADRRQ